MKKLLIASALSVAVLTQAGCATVAMAAVPSFAQKAQASSDAKGDKPQTDKRRIAKGAGFGCLLGAGLGALVGGKEHAVKGCAVGAVAGGVVAYQQQLKEAQEIEKQAKEAGMDATVTTKEVTDSEGKTTQALNALVIKYDAKDMQAMDADTQKTLDKIAGLAKKAKNTLTFTFQGKEHCQAPIDALRVRGAFERHTVVNKCGKGPSQITISPMPEVE